MSAPVLVTHNSTILMVDANDLVVGAVLVQKDHCGMEHPIVYFSQTFNKNQQNYCTSEKEKLTLILPLQHFDFYLSSNISIYGP